MQYRVLNKDGRTKMWTCDIEQIDPEVHSKQRALGYRFEVWDATPEELIELTRRGIKLKAKEIKEHA